MKHLIIFLNYCQSRIQNPVYRQFSMAPLANRNTTLLFLNKPLDERELMYEVSMLRRKDEVPNPVTFHICATLDRQDMGLQIAQTLTLIRRQFADSPMLAYCLMPDLNKCTDEERSAAWKSLVTVNNTVTDYQDIHFLQTCFLYTDESQRSLAHFLYDYTQYQHVQDIFTNKSLISDEKNDFPPIFSSFNANSLSYPDDNIRFHLHQQYLNALLSYSQPDVNPVSMETCLDQALSILSNLPLGLEQICLQESQFISLNPDTDKQWDEPEAYWTNATEMAHIGIKDMPKEDWLREFQTRLDVLYQRRFREVGVEYFFSYEQKKINDYNKVLLSGISQQLIQAMLSNPYPPEAQKDIVRAIVNQLQQRVLQVEQAMQQANIQINQLKETIAEYNRKWDHLGIFDRMRGKDTEILSAFENDIKSLYQLRVVVPGCQFAIKLLNELIPQVSALSEGSDHLTTICRDALHTTFRNIEESDPSALCGIFPSEPIMQAREAIKIDKEQLKKDYTLLLELLYGRNTLLDGDDLLQRMRNMYSEQIDAYIHKRINEGTMPAVLDINIAERIASIYDGHGGLSHFVYEMKQTTAIALLLKDNSGDNEQYILISPEHAEIRDSITSHSKSDLQMLHLKFDISLTDLDGFSGQRMFVEPSIF